MNVLSGIYPEIILSVGIIFILLFDIFLSEKISKSFISTTSLCVLFLSTSSIVFNINYFLNELFFLSSNIINDYVAIFFKLIFLLGGVTTVIISRNSNFLENKKSGEFYTLLLGAILGAMLIVSANNLLLFYLAFETFSISSYVLVGFGKEKSKEASLKYVLYGSVSSALMILGFSYIYGLTGTIDISRSAFAISDMLTLNNNVFVITISLLLVFVGIGYKISSFPFHFWTPDVYEGAPTSITAFLSVVSKSAGFAFLLRILLIPVGLWYEYFWNGDSLNIYQILLGMLAVFSMCYGNFVAIKQNNLKRLMGYSSIAHAGYMLLALSAGNKASIKAVMFYFVIYFFMNFTIFFFINFIEKLQNEKWGSHKAVTLQSIKGIGRHFPLICICTFISLISLAGLPPTGGFSGKFLLFDAIIQRALSFKEFGIASSFFFFLAFIGVVNSIVSLYYYMKIAKAMFLNERNYENFQVGSKKLFLVDGALMLLFTIFVLLLLNFSIADFLYNG